MTQNTQTTAERIQQEINFYYGYGPTAPRLSPLSERIAAEIDKMRSERDEAQKYRDQYVRECGELTAQLTEARAEVERLRPAAEAWEAMEAWRNPSGRTVSGVDMAYKAMVAAAARAREAKERKP